VQHQQQGSFVGKCPEALVRKTRDSLDVEQPGVESLGDRAYGRGEEVMVRTAATAAKAQLRCLAPTLCRDLDPHAVPPRKQQRGWTQSLLLAESRR
jgi:hypothetical protein